MLLLPVTLPTSSCALLQWPSSGLKNQSSNTHLLLKFKPQILASLFKLFFFFFEIGVLNLWIWELASMRGDDYLDFCFFFSVWWQNDCEGDILFRILHNLFLARLLSKDCWRIFVDVTPMGVALPLKKDVFITILTHPAQAILQLIHSWAEKNKPKPNPVN